MQIGEFSRTVRLDPTTLRWLEQHGLIPRPPRNYNGKRIYSEKHVQAIKELLLHRRASLGYSRPRARLALNTTQEGRASKTFLFEIRLRIFRSDYVGLPRTFLTLVRRLVADLVLFLSLLKLLK
jgi:DNA-binding transcriptional MerR regulator